MTLPFEIVPDGPRAGVVTLTLEQRSSDGSVRPVVVLDSALLKAIDATLDAIHEQHADAMTGLVLASGAPRSFVAGANLKEIMDLDDEALHAYLRFGAKVFARFATMPVTTVAAINSAALGGGLELAMHCDVLIGQQCDSGAGEKPFPIGLPEAGLGICPGWGGSVMLPARMDAQDAIVRTATGKPMKSDAAHDAGLLTELLEKDALLDRARELALMPKTTARSHAIAAGDDERKAEARTALVAAREELDAGDPRDAVLACVHEGVENGFEAACSKEREELVRLRSTEQGRASIQAFFDKTAKK